MTTKRVIAVIGQGFVGGSLSRGMQHTFDVYAYDKVGIMAQGVVNGARDKDGRDSLQTLVSRVEDPEGAVGKRFTGVYFVCLPTPMYEDGEADLHIVENTLAELADIPGERIAVIKSTVPPGSTVRWNTMFNSKGLTVVFNPEFLREASAYKDFINQNRIVLGGPRPNINKVKQVYEQAFPNVPIIKTSSTTAEMVKYITNIHLAVKVALANEFHQICTRLDEDGLNIDYDKVISYALYDERLGRSHWKVPGPMPADDTGEPAFGFGGSCFVKDLNALMFVAKTLGIDPKVMNGAWQKNLEVRPQRDWEQLVGRAVSKTCAHTNKK